MQSFYGGPAGQSFEIKRVFESYYGPDGAQVDLDKGWASPISVGEFVMVSYGLPSDEKYSTRQDYDLKAGNKKNLNSTLWQKVYDESAGEGSGLSYKLIASCTGNTPKIDIRKPAIVLHANEQPDVETDLSNQDMPVIKFKLPRAQVLSMPQKATVLDVGEEPKVDYNDNDIDNPTLHFSIPQSQNLQGVASQEIGTDKIPVAYLKKEGTYNVATGERAEDGTPITEEKAASVNEPVIVVELPQAQVIKDVDVEEVIPSTTELTAELIGDINRPTLKLQIPLAWDFTVGDTNVVDPDKDPNVEISDDDSTKTLTFTLPRAGQFYYVENKPASAADYNNGDIIIVATTNDIYAVINGELVKQGTLNPTFAAPVVNRITPYTSAGDVNTPIVALVQGSDGQWALTFGLPTMPNIKAKSETLNSTQEATASTEVTSADEVTFKFGIPRGSRLYSDKTEPVGVEDGDYWLNTETGDLYQYSNGSKTVAANLVGPVGSALNIEEEYHLTETEGYAANLENGVSYIEEHYKGTVDSTKIFAITWTLLDNGGDVAYWYYKTNAGNWDRVQLTGGVSSLIEQSYRENIDNKTYSINYINSLIGGEGDTSRTAYSKDQVQSLISWGSFQDLIEKP